MFQLFGPDRRQGKATRLVEAAWPGRGKATPIARTGSYLMRMDNPAFENQPAKFIGPQSALQQIVEFHRKVPNRSVQAQGKSYPSRNRPVPP